MALKAYYDGSGNDASMTLCGVAGTESLWKQFEPKWEAALRAHLVKDNLFHMCDLMAFKNNFSRELGWDKKQRRVLLNDLFNVVGLFRGAENHFVAYLCTVVLRDWKRAKQKLPMLPPPEKLCVNFCVGGLHLPMKGADERKPILLYFDRNEKFMCTIRRTWDRFKKKPGKLGQIGTIESVDSEYYPIQLADLLAWTANRSANCSNSRRTLPLCIARSDTT